MFALLSKDVEFIWTNQCQLPFEALKEKLSQALVLRGPYWSLPFHISTDASDTTIGVVLG
jgi:hypothetical protein